MKTIKTLLLAIALGSTGVRAEDAAIPEAEVPKQVLEAVAKKFPTATSRSFEKEIRGSTVRYEAELKVPEGAKTRSVTLELSKEGNILSEEEVITFEELPGAVKTALQASRLRKADVVEVEREVKDGRTTYEVSVKASGGKRELVYDAKGALVKNDETEAPEPSAD